MPAKIKIIHAHEFIKATPEGKLDLDESKELLMEIAVASSPLNDYEIILDTRKALLDMSIADLWYLAAELGKYYNTYSRKTAVICSQKRFDYAGFFALCSQNNGFLVSAFSSFEDAMEWLIKP